MTFFLVPTTSFLWSPRIFTAKQNFVIEAQLPIVYSRVSLTSLNVGGGKNLSASDQERRDEEKRRRKRKNEVVIGKTSAKKGEADYELDPKATEQEFLRQASHVEQEVFRQTAEGKKMLNSVRFSPI